MYDGKIGRWLSTDPQGQFASPYEGMGNNPVTDSDPTGSYSWFGALWRQAASFIAGNDPSSIYKSGNEWGFNAKNGDEYASFFGPLKPNRYQTQIDASLSIGFSEKFHPELVRVNVFKHPEVEALQTPIIDPIDFAGGLVSGGIKGLAAAGTREAEVLTVEELAVHGNSLKSLKPTWGYKLYSEDGTFLKNGITSKLVPEARYTKAFMSDKYMEPILFPNRAAAYGWEFQQNQIMRGPLNLNMH